MGRKERLLVATVATAVLVEPCGAAFIAAPTLSRRCSILPHLGAWAGDADLTRSPRSLTRSLTHRESVRGAHLAGAHMHDGGGGIGGAGGYEDELSERESKGLSDLSLLGAFGKLRTGLPTKTRELAKPSRINECFEIQVAMLQHLCQCPPCFGARGFPDRRSSPPCFSEASFCACGSARRPPTYSKSTGSAQQSRCSRARLPHSRR